jgi:hypothetical protein
MPGVAGSKSAPNVSFKTNKDLEVDDSGNTVSLHSMIRLRQNLEKFRRISTEKLSTRQAKDGELPAAQSLAKGRQ